MLNGVPRYPEVAARAETEMTKMIIFGPGRRSIGDNRAYGWVRYYRHMLGLVTRARKCVHGLQDGSRRSLMKHCTALTWPSCPLVTSPYYPATSITVNTYDFSYSQAIH
nr:hypothetical protein L203_06361 [Cryptococcus depauperatus CBS 7841]